MESLVLHFLVMYVHASFHIKIRSLILSDAASMVFARWRVLTGARWSKLDGACKITRLILPYNPDQKKLQDHPIAPFPSITQHGAQREEDFQLWRPPFSPVTGKPLVSSMSSHVFCMGVGAPLVLSMGGHGAFRSPMYFVWEHHTFFRSGAW